LRKRGVSNMRESRVFGARSNKKEGVFGETKKRRSIL